MNLDQALQTAKDLALKAGQAVMEVYNEAEVTVSQKEGNEPLTEADLRSHKIIAQGLQEAFPEHAVLSEEGKDNNSRLEKEYVWVVDPLDGTKEFIKRNGEFTVNIALTQNKIPILGVIYVPAKKELFYAAKGNGAYFEKESVKEPLRVSSRKEKKDMILVQSRSHANPELTKYFNDETFANIKSIGSSLKGCLIAQSQADIYPRITPIKEWDICAMHAIVHEAGGRITNWKGEDIQYNNEDIIIKGILVSNNLIHEELVNMRAA